MRRLTVDSRLLGSALLAAVAAAFVLVATRPPATTPVLVTGVPAAAGTRIDDMQLVERSVLDPSGLVPAAERDGLDGAFLTVDLAAGVPLVDAAIGGHGSATTDVIGVELDAAAAVHGALVPGDRVDAHHATEGGEMLAAGITIVGVVTDDGALGTRGIGLLLAVDSELASRLVAAIHGDGVYLVRAGR